MVQAARATARRHLLDALRKAHAPPSGPPNPAAASEAVGPRGAGTGRLYPRTAFTAAVTSRTLCVAAPPPEPSTPRSPSAPRPRRTCQGSAPRPNRSSAAPRLYRVPACRGFALAAACQASNAPPGSPSSSLAAPRFARASVAARFHGAHVRLVRVITGGRGRPRRGWHRQEPTAPRTGPWGLTLMYYVW